MKKFFHVYYYRRYTHAKYLRKYDPGGRLISKPIRLPKKPNYLGDMVCGAKFHGRRESKVEPVNHYLGVTVFWY
jgi:hypothetical protein